MGFIIIIFHFKVNNIYVFLQPIFTKYFKKIINQLRNEDERQEGSWNAKIQNVLAYQH